MPNIDAWAGDTFPLMDWSNDADQATDAARIIADKSQSIVIAREGTNLAAQTVRLETSGGGGQIIDDAGRQHQVGATLWGYNGHPTITDTDVQPGDRFVDSESMAYEVVAVLVSLPNRLQAICVVRT